VKVLFVYYDVNSSEPARYACGLGALSAYIKKHGHETHLSYIKTEDDYEILKKKIIEYKPDLIGISATTSGFLSVNNLSCYIKSIIPGTMLLLGGSHVSITPEDIASLEDVDGVCIGYGEKPLLQLITTMENGDDYFGTPNFWFRRNGDIVKNEKLPFPDSWDDFFDFDRELFFEELDRLNPDPYGFGRGLLGSRVFEYILCRACPFACDFCAAPLIKTWGTGKGWLSHPSPEAAVKKLKDDKEKYQLTGFAFHDDVFTFNKRWFTKFAELYKKELGLPYVCNVRVGTFDGHILDALIESNCKMAIAGVESGNDYIRNKIANRRLSREHIITSLTKLKNSGISLYINNMIGFPEETFERFVDTVDINAIIGPKRSNASVYYPYPGTKLYAKCIEEGIIEPHRVNVNEERFNTVLNLPGFPKKQIERIAPVFHLLVMYQRIVYKLFGQKSRLSIKHTEPVVSFLSSIFLVIFFRARKIKDFLSTYLISLLKKII
jgi:anaerobic magnesium-protoporphyrin IX monomethyl ester cyclase